MNRKILTALSALMVPAHAALNVDLSSAGKLSPHIPAVINPIMTPATQKRIPDVTIPHPPGNANAMQLTPSPKNRLHKIRSEASKIDPPEMD